MPWTFSWSARTFDGRLRAAENTATTRKPLSIPFGAASVEVLIACQRHFSGLPPDFMLEVAVIEAGVARSSATYFIPHMFEPVAPT